MRLITIPRLIGIALFALAWPSYPGQGLLRVSLLALAGIIFLLSPAKSAEKHWQEFVKSLKPSKDYALVMLFDIIFWALLAILTLLLAIAVRTPYEQLKTVQFSAGVNIGTLEASNAILETFFTTAIAALIAYWIAVVAAYSLSRGLIWLTLNKKPMSKSFLLKFSLLNLAWCTAWLAIILLFLTFALPPASAYAFIFLLVLYAYLTTRMHNSYAKHGMIRTAGRETFSLDSLILFLRLHFTYLFIIYLILSQAGRFVQGNAELIITFFIFLIYMAWYRVYLRNILRRT